MLKGRLAGMTKQLLLFRTLLLIVSVVIISLVIYTFTMEKIRSIAVMKLIGAPNLIIVRLVMEQSMLSTLSAFLFGLLLINKTYHLFPKTLVLVSGDDLVTFMVALLGGILASILGLWQALKTQPAHGPGGLVMEVLKIEGLSKIFGSGRLEVRALEDINLSVAGGDLVALLGPSGSGKTTMLLCASLILEPTPARSSLTARPSIKKTAGPAWISAVSAGKRWASSSKPITSSPS